MSKSAEAGQMNEFGRLRGHSSDATWSGVQTFLRRAYRENLIDVDVAVTGAPYDCATTNRPGTRFGPRAIREASLLQPFEAPYGWDVDPLRELNIADCGDVEFDHGKLNEFPMLLERHIGRILDAGAAALTLGGDHYVSYPILKAHAARYGPLALVQFDAHTDTWSHGSGDRMDHGTMFRQAAAEGLLVPERSVQVGIRTTNPDTLGFNIIDARTVHLQGPLAAASAVREIVGDRRVYLSFDIDGLDPAFAPGTGTPVWGGLTSAQAAIILREIAGINLIGMDVVEVSPQYDTTGATAIAAAHVATDLICLWQCGARGR